MKKFVELIQRVHNERFSVVMNKIVAGKIPVAFLSIEPIEKASVTVASLIINYDINVTYLVTTQSDPPPRLGLKGEDIDISFNVIALDKFSTLQPRIEYVLVIDSGWDVTNARVACKNITSSKIISFRMGVDYTKDAYDFFMNHLTDLQSVYESLIDEESKRTFRGYWLGNISHQLGDIPQMG